VLYCFVGARTDCFHAIPSLPFALSVSKGVERSNVKKLVNLNLLLSNLPKFKTMNFRKCINPSIRRRSKKLCRTGTLRTFSPEFERRVPGLA